MPDNNGYTQTEARIMDLLNDWRLHKPEELRALLNDGTNPNNLHVTLSHLRVKLRKIGQDVCCGIVNREWYYQLFSVTDPRLINSSNQSNLI